MSLTLAPNRITPPQLEQGDTGWPVYGLQIALDDSGRNLVADGDFGPATYKALRDFQRNYFLGADGVAGDKTQARLIALLDHKTHERHDKLPDGLLRGVCDTESGNKFGAVNWSVKGGVDCGVVQIRCYGPPYKHSELRAAYNPVASMERAALTFEGRVISYRTMHYASRQKLQWAQRCAALAWNWPYAAEQYAMHGKLPNPDKNAEWATYVEGGKTKRIKFPDGTPVMTWKDWSEFYALGGKHGEGKVTRFVKW